MVEQTVSQLVDSRVERWVVRMVEVMVAHLVILSVDD